MPLVLTVGRMFISPIFLVIYLKYGSLGIGIRTLPFILLALLGLSELSDFFDGYLARKFDVVTQLGKILDPMSDSITRLTMLLTFTQGIIALPLFLVFVFIYRDAVVSALRTICAFKGVTLAARTSGKVKAVLQAVAICSVLALMIPYAFDLFPLDRLRLFSRIIIAMVACYGVYSGVEYILANRLYIKQAIGSLSGDHR
ncbi:MAG: CDP-alcohol phosphatidyltransferase family protein [Simkaniaceae bacterium]|nr:CDP-alcohol phosphatidyltransferase family protein [Simkaniaceae bacterium]